MKRAENPTAMAEAVRAHASACEDCAGAPLPAEEIGDVLGSYAVAVDAASLSQKVVLCLRPELAAMAAAAFRRRAALALLAALVPLPAIALFDVWVLHSVYTLVCMLLPAAVAAYLVLTYASVLLLVLAATYAAIPLLIARALPARAAAT